MQLRDFLFQMSIQLPIIVLFWVLITRDADKVRERNGSTPAAISPFAWGALCGLTFLALIPYFILRFKLKTKTETHAKERNLMTWWIVLSVASSVWAASQYKSHDTNNAAQHFILAATFLACAIYAWYRDRHKTD